MTGKKRRSIRKAVALKYTPHEDAAPKLAAKGRGVVAEKIIEIARKHNIPVKNDPELIEILCLLDYDEEIPPSVYQVVAEILAFVYSLKGKRREKG
ncbi:MAG: EscU/YscU/HrcU family type III secretion system export apparatus switch protein [Pseudomonadota bacterium]